MKPLSSAMLSALLLASLFASLLAPLAAAAADTPLEFAEPALERRYQSLLTELRCLVCQNQSLADSHADLAQDLRQEVYEQVLDGKSDAAIIKFLVERYGDFVIYRPRFNYRTALLWGGPFLLLLAVVLFLWRLLARQRAGGGPALTEAERQRLKNLLDDKQP